MLGSPARLKAVRRIPGSRIRSIMTSLCLQQDLNTWFTKGFLDADFTIAASLRSSADLQIGPVPLRITMPGNGCMNGARPMARQCPLAPA